MNDLTGAACAGEWELFDSTHPDDHDLAKRICRGCPALEACSVRTEELHAKRGPGGMRNLTGTWAGRLFGGDPELVRVRLLAEDRMFTDAEARLEHRRFSSGEQDHRAALGERVYQRRVGRRKRERQRAGAVA